MMKVTSELVLLFAEDGEPTGMLVDNGKREFYSIKRATKEQVSQLLEVDKPTQQ